MMVGAANPHKEKVKYELIKHLKAFRNQLTKQEIQTIRGQAKSDPIAARKGLATLLEKKGMKANLGRW